MPSTITSFYTFSPATKARSSEANTNFSNFRGTFVPIEENTAAASQNTHALGQVDHRWTTVYAGTLDLRGMTSTSNLVLRNNTALTVGAAEFLLGSQTLGNWGLGEIGFAGQTTTQYTKLQYQAGVTAGALDLLMGSSTLSSFTTDGLKHRTKAPMQFTSASAPLGTALYLGQTSLNMLISTTGAITLCAARISAKGGGLIRLGLSNTAPYIYGATTAITDFYASVRAYRGTTTTAMTLLSESFCHARPATTGLVTTGVALFPEFLDNGYAAGEVCYELRLAGNTGNGVGHRFLVYGNFFIKEE